MNYPTTMNAVLLAAALLLTAAPAQAQVNPKIAKQCQSAADFAGCVKAFTTPAVVIDDIQPLRNAMKQVAERLSAGTSLNNSSATYQPVIDQLALVETSHSSDPSVVAARQATNMFSYTQEAWRIRINAKVYNKYFPDDAYNCKALKITADGFDQQFQSSINWAFSTTGIARFLGMGSICRVPESQLPESYMYRKVIDVLRDGSAPAATSANTDNSPVRVHKTYPGAFSYSN